MGDWLWPDSLDAVVAAPKHHQLVLDNDQARVLDTRIHPSPPGQPARFIESLPPHSIENVGASEIHLMSVEIKSR